MCEQGQKCLVECLLSFLLDQSVDAVVVMDMLEQGRTGVRVISSTGEDHAVAMPSLTSFHVISLRTVFS